MYVPANHRYAGRTSIALKELSEDGFIGIRKGLGMREAIDGFCREAGFTPQIKFEGEDIPTIAALVSSGLGVTIIPAFQGISAKKIKKIAITEPYCHREIGLAWLTGHTLSPAAELFRNYVMETFT